MNFLPSNTKNEILSDTKIIITYVKVEIISKKQLACVYNEKSLFFLINMYIKVNKIEYIWLNCQLGGLFQYEKAKIILEIERRIDFSFFIFLVYVPTFFG